MKLTKYLSLTILFLFLSCLCFNAQTKPDFNRPSNYDVQHYIIRAGFDRPNKKVFGDTTVQLKPLKEGFNQVELDAEGLAFETVTLEPQNTTLKFRTTATKVIVSLDKSYGASDLISIRFKYSCTPKKGVYFVSEMPAGTLASHSEQIWTQGEPDEAHHWFPSFDFPSDKATTEQFITAEKGETVVGNGELIEQIENADGTVTFHYKMPVPHSVYLVSFVIGKYVKVSDKYKNIPLGYYVYPGRQAIVPKAYGRTKDMMRIFEELTGVDYPFNKYDQTFVANFQAGGMENITATTMADTEIFYADFDFAQGIVEDLVSHELAHSWFGNLVTCKNWAELWLNEGFATFMEAAYREKKYGREDYMRKIGEDAAAFVADDAVNPRRHGLYNLNARDVDSLFLRSGTTYSKGGAIIHTLREELGEDAFWKGINLYLTRHKFAAVESTDLQKAMEESSGKDLNWFFKQWVYGSGHPKLNVRPTYSTRTKTLRMTVTQTQRIDKITPAAFILPVEVGIRTPRGTKIQKINIKKRIEVFSIKLAGRPVEINFDKPEKIPVKLVTIRPLARLH